MRKLLSIGTVALLAGAALGQGTINFQNTQSQLVTTNYLGNTGRLAVGAGKVALYYVPGATAAGTINNNVTVSGLTLNGFGSAAWAAAGTAVGIGGAPPIAGTFNGGTLTTGTDVAAGAAAYIQIRAWTGSYATWDAAVAAAATDPSVLLGWWNSAVVNTGGGGSPPGAPLTLAQAGFTGLALNSIGTAPIPEPSTFALAGLGLASLLIFRRRK